MSVDYDHLSEKLALAVQASMWNEDYATQVDPLSELRDALSNEGRDLPLPEAARLRLDVLQVLDSADEYADDPRAKEFGTLYCLLENMPIQTRSQLAAKLMALLRFTSARVQASSR